MRRTPAWAEAAAVSISVNRRRSWSSGTAQLGYGDGDETTVVSYGADSSHKYITTYFRRTFTVTDPSQYQTVLLRLQRDDGAVVYLNGSEVLRSNLPGGVITYTVKASTEISGFNELQFYTATVPITALVSGPNLIAVEIHQYSGISADISFDLELVGTPLADTLISAGASWKYLDNGTNQGTAWQSPTFTDTTWSTGAAQLGYGDGDEATVVSYGPDPNNKYITTYFRKTFTVTNPAAYQRLPLKLLADDGAVVYVNGIEALRTYVPTGTVAYTTKAALAANEPEENRFNLFYLSPSLLVSGTNVVAVEVHQVVTNTADCSFDLALFGQAVITPTVIRYTYDPLYRLTGAAYSGAYTYTFAYAYDPVGNRTAQTSTITSTLVTTYTYDAANRMTKVGITNYTWDNNGNLTNNGSSLYRYDQANRMISTTLATTTTLFNYNGDGVRLKQVIAGVPTTYTQDLAAPLPVVLQAKTGTTATHYLYSMGTRPVAQYTSSAWQYLLPDALGSVRQIADASSNILLTESYQPYGSLLNSSGSASSIFAYAGEQADTGGLIYLRARYMNPRLGIFLSEDTLPGIASLPQSLHIFSYARNNPINLIDPSGQQTPPPKCDFGDICSTGPTGSYVGQTPPVPAQYTPKPPPPELLNAPTGFVSGFSSTADLGPWGIHISDVQIGNQLFCGNGIIGGEEWVWDYRHLQKAKFTYFGITKDFGSLFGGYPAQFYTGIIRGFKKDINEYNYWFRASYGSYGKYGISLMGGEAIGLDENGNEAMDGIKVSYGGTSFGLGVGAPAGVGTSYTYYQRVTPIIGVQPGSSLSRANRAVLAEVFARDIENTAPLDQLAQMAANLARIWGNYDPQ